MFVNPRWVSAIAVAFVMIKQAGADDVTLGSKLQPMIDEHQGKLAIAVKNLKTGEEYLHNANEIMTTASLIKVAVMVEAYWQAEEGKISLDSQIMLRKADMVPGAGVLTDSFSAGSILAVRDAMRLMITVSDNTATNLVLDEVGIAAVNARMKSLGLPETRINAKVFRGSTTSVDPERTKKYGLGSTTAREMMLLLEKIVKQQVVTPTACKEMQQILGKNQDNEMMVRLLPPGVSVAHKTGAVSNARTDAGIVSVRDPSDKTVKPLFVICVLTNENKDQRWVVDNRAQLTIARITRTTFDHFLAEEK